MSLPLKWETPACNLERHYPCREECSTTSHGSIWFGTQLSSSHSYTCLANHEPDSVFKAFNKYLNARIIKTKTKKTAIKHLWERTLCFQFGSCSRSSYLVLTCTWALQQGAPAIHLPYIYFFVISRHWNIWKNTCKQEYCNYLNTLYYFSHEYPTPSRFGVKMRLCSRRVDALLAWQ